jgi:hypothetical protein
LPATVDYSYIPPHCAPKSPALPIVQKLPCGQILFGSGLFWTLGWGPKRGTRMSKAALEGTREPHELPKTRQGTPKTIREATIHSLYYNGAVAMPFGAPCMLELCYGWCEYCSPGPTKCITISAVLNPTKLCTNAYAMCSDSSSPRYQSNMSPHVCVCVCVCACVCAQQCTNIFLNIGAFPSGPMK